MLATIFVKWHHLWHKIQQNATITTSVTTTSQEYNTPGDNIEYNNSLTDIADDKTLASH